MNGLSKRIRILLWVIFTLWLLLMVWLSSEDGVSTARTSRWLAALVVRVLGFPPSQLIAVDRMLRTAFHFTGFFVLSALMFAALRPTLASDGAALLLAISVCSVIAVLDEVKKVLISGRHLSWSEARLNVLGVCCGALAVYWLSQWVAWRKQRREKA